MHPYEMYQLMLERHEDRIVKVRPGSLYHTVERLQGLELVRATGVDRAGNRPERTTYAITDAGREALASRVSELLRTPVREYPHFPKALSEAHNLPAEQAVADLTAYLEGLEDDITELSSVIKEAGDRNVPETYWVVADYLLTTAVAQRNWIRTLINRIETKDLTWQPHKA